MPFVARPLPVLCGVAVSLLLIFSVGCRRGDNPDAVAEAERLEVPGRPLTGQIVKVDTERGTLLVDHDPIPDYMPQMVMEFQVTPAELANAVEGQRIRARLIEEANGKFSLSHIWAEDDLARTQIGTAAAALRQDTTIRGNSAYRSVGENLPDFALYDQTGEVVNISRFRGKNVLINFIYTRCPIATMCPAAVTLMETVQQRVAEQNGSDRLELISITFDPEYDTPGVLRSFAEARGIDTSNYSFMTGPESAIKDLLRQFGVIAEVEGPLIQHTLATLLIDEGGRIIDRADGSQWDVDQFVRKIMR
jgi:protein SCO1